MGGYPRDDIENGFHVRPAEAEQEEPVIDRFAKPSPFKVEQRRDPPIVGQPVAPVTVCVDRNLGHCSKRRPLCNRCQTVEQMATNHVESISFCEAFEFGDQGRLTNEATVVKRFPQRLFGAARRNPAVQCLQILERILGQQAGGHTVDSGQAHAWRCPRHPRITGIANVASAQSVVTAGEERGREPGRQVRRERDLPVQTRVPLYVDDLHSDLGTDEDIVGTASSHGHRTWVPAQGRFRNRPGGLAVYRVHVISGQRVTSDSSLKGASGILSSLNRSANSTREGQSNDEVMVAASNGRLLQQSANVRLDRAT